MAKYVIEVQSSVTGKWRTSSNFIDLKNGAEFPTLKAADKALSKRRSSGRLNYRIVTERPHETK